MIGRLSLARRLTVQDARHGKPPGADALIARWNESMTRTLLEFVWRGYDALLAVTLARVRWDADYREVERSICQAFDPMIRDAMTDHAACYIQHAPYEYESGFDGRAQSPQYDLAFVLYSDPRIMWPLEAKVLNTDRDTERNLKNYIDTVKGRYLTCYYAPFSNGGAMLGFLKVGDSAAVLDHIEARLASALIPYAPFPNRPHRVSAHPRTVPPGKGYPADFHCHHLILALSDE